MRIVETDNYNGDYPDETFLAHSDGMVLQFSSTIATIVADALNSDCNPDRFWIVVEDNYQLASEFKP